MKASKEKFDLIVHRRDKKTGRVTEVNAYVMRKHQGVSYFERPKGSGNLFFENNEPAGRYEAGKFNLEAKHIDWVAPLSPEESVQQAVASAMSENARLKAELSEIKREQKYAKAPAAKIEKVMGKEDKEQVQGSV